MMIMQFWPWSMKTFGKPGNKSHPKKVKIPIKTFF